MSSSPNIHALVVAVLAVVMLGAWMSDRTPPDQANAAAAPAVASVAEVAVGAEAAPVPAPAAVDAPPPAPARSEPFVASVEPGDSLARIFKRHGLSDRDLHLVVTSSTLGSRLANIFPGHELAFEQDDEGNVVYLRYSPGRLETIEFKRVGEQFEGTRVVVEPEEVPTYKRAAIESSLYLASQQAGLPDQFTHKLVQIFRWDIDFLRDIRKGDQFHVLYNELHIDGHFHGWGDILAAEVTTQDKRYQAVRYEDEAGNANHYTPDGRNMQKKFLRAPLEFTRISSNFNLKRVHPLWKSAMPHRGIDYAAPTGTRVMAAADGRVTTVGYTKANGNYIVLQHGGSHSTKYLHLSRFASGLKEGRRVSQGDTIGYVGATGWATGPHLHYEFLVNGVHKDPRTVKLPEGTPISDAERELFALASGPLLAQLADHKDRVRLAYADTAQ